MLGPIGMALNLSACVGPVVGGTVAYTKGNHTWVFWSLTVVGVILFVAVGTFLPETARNIVGNSGDKKRYSWWQLTWLSLIQRSWSKKRVTAKRLGASTLSNVNSSVSPTTKDPLLRGLKNLFACFRLIFYQDTFLTVWLHASFYTVDYSFVTALPDIFKDTYHFNELQVGLEYLLRGVGIITGNFFMGKLMDHNYQVIRKQNSPEAGEEVKGENFNNFPIERLRSRGSYWMLAISTGTMIGYGWAVHSRVHLAVPLILQFAQGFWGTFFYTTYSILLVDVFPERSSTAAAATSVTRCAMAAASVAILDPLLHAAGHSWYFTMLGLWSGGFGVVAVMLLRSKWMGWRRIRMAKQNSGD